MSHLLIVAVFTVLAVLTHAQTFTSTDINGNTIVGVLTLIQGIPVTSTIGTISAVVTTTSSTTTLVPTTDPVVANPIPTTTSVTTDAGQGEQGPVGQPTATSFSPGGPTPYTYTTVINGVTSVVLDTFIPTNPATQSPTVTATGTIWDFSSWQAVFAPSSTAGVGASGAVGGPSLMSGSLVLGLAVGIWLVLY